MKGYGNTARRLRSSVSQVGEFYDKRLCSGNKHQAHQRRNKVTTTQGRCHAHKPRKQEASDLARTQAEEQYIVGCKRHQRWVLF